MKKFIFTFLAIITLTTLSGCGANQNVENNQKEIKYADGTYRGGYIDPTQVEISFELKDGKFNSVKFRKLSYNGENYLKSEDTIITSISSQYLDLANYLVGKELSALADLYTPANITNDIDGFTAATLRSAKIISAINDGLNRGLYALPKE